MPRPPARRTRGAPKTKTSTTAKTAAPDATKSVEKAKDTTQQAKTPSPKASRRNNRGTITSATAVAANRTPTTATTNAANDFAVESSPASHIGTGSRPPSRTRGYSSTLSLAGRNAAASGLTTPGFESSILSNFRRRPRQPSILQLMQAEDNSSELDDDDFLKSLSPEDESTPLNVARPKSLLPEPEKEAEPEPELPSSPSLPSGGSRKRKRSSVNVRDRMSSRVDRDGSPLPRESSLIENAGSAPEEEKVPSSVVMSQTMLPPMSSPGSPTQNVAAARGQRRLRHDRNEEEDVEEDDDETPTEPPPALPTAMLQAKFLPRRRVRPRQLEDDEEEDVSAEDSEGDELAVPRRSRRARNRGLFEAPSANSKVKARAGRGARKQDQSRDDPEPRKTRLRQADKENIVDDDSSELSSLPPSEDLGSESEFLADPPARQQSNELELARKKFSEIDKWEMEFEDVMSSPERQ